MADIWARTDNVHVRIPLQTVPLVPITGPVCVGGVVPSPVLLFFPTVISVPAQAGTPPVTFTLPSQAIVRGPRHQRVIITRGDPGTPNTPVPVMRGGSVIVVKRCTP